MVEDEARGAGARARWEGLQRTFGRGQRVDQTTRDTLLDCFYCTSQTVGAGAAAGGGWCFGRRS